MNTLEILLTLEKDAYLQQTFMGVFASDQLPIVKERPACFIANTDPAHKPGEHWIAMYFGNDVEYFDSYGLPPPKEFAQYKPEIVNEYCLQNFDSVVCGEYCCYFLLKRSRHTSFDKIVLQLRKKGSSDRFVKQYMDRLRKRPLKSCGQYCVCRK